MLRLEERALFGGAATRFIRRALLLLVAAGALAAARLGSSRYVVNLVRFSRPPRALVVPVADMSRKSLQSTFGAPRSGGRLHKGADLFAPRGTHVLSATRGVVWKVGLDDLGGRVVLVFGEGPALYYYAHLDGWAPELRAGQEVSAGDLLGYVGTTGNARGTPPHLHFGVYRANLRGAHAVDPVPILKGGG